MTKLNKSKKLYFSDKEGRSEGLRLKLEKERH